jgi:hypothetical protein
MFSDYIPLFHDMSGCISKVRVGNWDEPFGQKKTPDATRGSLFDQKLLVHATNSVAGILYEIRNAPQGTPISFQQLLTVSLEKKFSASRMHAGRHSMLDAIFKTMEVDAVRKFISAYVHLKNQRLAYGEIVDTCYDLPDMEISPLVFAQAVLCVLGFPAHMIFAMDRLGPPPEDQVYHLVGKLMSDELMTFTKPRKSLMSWASRRSLYQKLKCSIPSSRRVIRSSKSDMAGVMGGHKAINPHEKELGALIDRPRILLTALKILIEEASTAAHLRFMIEDGDRHHLLHRATKREVLQWIIDHWENYHELFT